MFSAHGILCASPAPSREWYLKILQSRPDVIDLLFKVAALPRPVAYPEVQMDHLGTYSSCFLSVMSHCTH